MSPEAAEILTWTTSTEVKMAWQELSETRPRASRDKPGEEGQVKV